MLLLSDGACHGGRVHDARAKGMRIVAALPSVRRVVTVDYVMRGADGPAGWPGLARWSDLLADESDAPFAFERFPFSQPLYVLFTSGTTGRPMHRARRRRHAAEAPGRPSAAVRRAA
ncbi:MAG: hypothetical protein REJ50_00360 [Bordetella sp.]|nr:hypothetical protein [Bordetella sp.]